MPELNPETELATITTDAKAKKAAADKLAADKAATAVTTPPAATTAAPEAPTSPEAPAATPTEPEAATPAAPAIELVAGVDDVFAIGSARINLNGSEEGQNRYNLLIRDIEAIDALKLLGETLGVEGGFTATNAQGDCYVSVTMGGQSTLELARAGDFKAFTVKGTLTIVDRNKRTDGSFAPTGHFVIERGGARPVSLLDGGRTIDRTGRAQTGVPGNNRTGQQARGGARGFGALRR